jgi:hypothetical protein
MDSCTVGTLPPLEISANCLEFYVWTQISQQV